MNNYFKTTVILALQFMIYANVGNLMISRGEVSIIRSEGEITPKKNELLKLGDIIETKKNAVAILKLSDKTIIKINELSSIKINNLLNENSPTEIELKDGSSFFEVEKNVTKSRDKLILKTRTASLGVRGTTFFTAVSNTNHSSDTWMCVKEGEVIARSINTRESKIVRTGEGIKISEESRLQNPRFLPWTKGLNWELDYQNTDKDIENKLNIREAYEDILNTDYE